MDNAASLVHMRAKTDKRGAALILEIAIYLVIVALIVVALISGIRAVRDLVFTTHAKGDIRTVQTWLEGKYMQDNQYIPTSILKTGPVGDQPSLTTANGETNEAWVAVSHGANSGYCIKVVSNSISNRAKSNFWLQSVNPSHIYQSGTATNGSSLVNDGAPSGGTVTCPPADFLGLGAPPVRSP